MRPSVHDAASFVFIMGEERVQEAKGDVAFVERPGGDLAVELLDDRW